MLPYVRALVGLTFISPHPFCEPVWTTAFSRFPAFAGWIAVCLRWFGWRQLSSRFGWLAVKHGCWTVKRQDYRTRTLLRIASYWFMPALGS